MLLADNYPDAELKRTHLVKGYQQAGIRREMILLGKTICSWSLERME